MNISIFIVCYNEGSLIKHTIQHYKNLFNNPIITIYDNESTDNSVEIAKSLGCNIISWNSNNVMNEYTLLKIRNNCWKNSTNDWVIMIDMDEWLCISENELIELDKNRVTILKTQGFEIVGTSKSILLDDIDLHTLNTGIYNNYESKSVCFNKNKINNINYSIGAHNANPYGNIKYSDKTYFIKHMNFLGIPYSIHKNKIRYERAENMRKIQNNNHNTHYSNDDEIIKNKYIELITKSISMINTN